MQAQEDTTKASKEQTELQKQQLQLQTQLAANVATELKIRKMEAEDRRMLI